MLGVVALVAGATSGGAEDLRDPPQGCGWGHRTQTCTHDTDNLVTVGPMAYLMPGTPSPVRCHPYVVTSVMHPKKRLQGACTSVPVILEAYCFQES